MNSAPAVARSRTIAVPACSADPDFLTALLINAAKAIPLSEFVGIGLVLYSDLSTLPVIALRHAGRVERERDIAALIAEASRKSGDCHDGFHLISRSRRLTHRNQYFAPPIPAGAELHFARKGAGARYVSALLGSVLPCVDYTAIVSSDGEISVFCRGIELRRGQLG
jgi:hypothetical protein